jgi:hypothetical protein
MDLDRDLWRKLLSSVKRAARSLPKAKRRPKFPDWLIVAMYLWCVWHDRPLCWGCDRSHYGALFRPRKLPSVSQFSRRVRGERFRLILQRVHQDLAGWCVPTALSYLDGKPLPVGAASHDRQARVGKVSGGFARGYKLHGWVTEDRRLPVWSVQPLNVGEPLVAWAMLPHLPPLPAGRALVLADGNYDDRDLHKGLDAAGARLLAPPRGFAEHPVTLRQMGPARREALEVWTRHTALAEHVHHHRLNVEGTFSNLCSFGGGLGPLPAWARGQERVTRWVGAKIIIYHARLAARKAAAA